MPPQGEPLAAETFRVAQLAVSKSLIQYIVDLLEQLLDPRDFARSWPLVRSMVARLIRSSRLDSAAAGRDYYVQARAAARRADGFDPAEPRPVEDRRIFGALDSAGPAVFRKAIASGATPQQARDRMAVTLTGTATRLALEGGRDVVEASVLDDDDALGWARVGDGDPCSWCAMLISRGAVYKSGETAGDIRFGGEKYHDHDGCQAVPIFDPNSPLLAHADDLYDQWRQATAGTSGKEAIKTWRRYWDNRDSATSTS